MKKKILIFSILAIIFIIVLCIIIVKSNENKLDGSNESSVIIMGEIKSIESNDYLVLNSDNGIMEVYYNDCNQFLVGQKIKVIYDGSILETLPPKISAISIELIE